MNGAKSLKSQEIALKSKLDVHTKHILLSDEKIVLKKSLLEECNYSDPCGTRMK